MQGDDGVDLVAAIGADLQDYPLHGGEAGQAEVEEDERVQVPGDGCALQRDPRGDPHGDQAQRDPGAEPVFEPVGCLFAERKLLGANRRVTVPQPGAWPYHCRITSFRVRQIRLRRKRPGGWQHPVVRATTTRPCSGRSKHIRSWPAAVNVDRRRCTWMYETTNETAAQLSRGWPVEGEHADDGL